MTHWPAARKQVAACDRGRGPSGLSRCRPRRLGQRNPDTGIPRTGTRHAGFLALGGLSRTGDLAFGSTPEAPERWTPRMEAALERAQSEDDLEGALIAAEKYEEGAKRRRAQLAQLLIHSSDIGGARPKARVRISEKEWIAKFSAWDDRFDNPRAEAVCLDFAEAAGLQVPERELRVVNDRPVLLVSRFDRSSAGACLSYLSAGTLLGEPLMVMRQARPIWTSRQPRAVSVYTSRNARFFAGSWSMPISGTPTIICATTLSSTMGPAGIFHRCSMLSRIRRAPSMSAPRLSGISRECDASTAFAAYINLASPLPKPVPSSMRFMKLPHASQYFSTPEACRGRDREIYSWHASARYPGPPRTQ